MCLLSKYLFAGSDLALYFTVLLLLSSLVRARQALYPRATSSPGWCLFLAPDLKYVKGSVAHFIAQYTWKVLWLTEVRKNPTVDFSLTCFWLHGIIMSRLPHKSFLFIIFEKWLVQPGLASHLIQCVAKAGLGLPIFRPPCPKC